jgi:hypothetical protein
MRPNKIRTRKNARRNKSLRHRGGVVTRSGTATATAAINAATGRVSQTNIHFICNAARLANRYVAEARNSAAHAAADADTAATLATEADAMIARGTTAVNAATVTATHDAIHDAVRTVADAANAAAEAVTDAIAAATDAAAIVNGITAVNIDTISRDVIIDNINRVNAARIAANNASHASAAAAIDAANALRDVYRNYYIIYNPFSPDGVVYPLGNVPPLELTNDEMNSNTNYNRI